MGSSLQRSFVLRAVGVAFLGGCTDPNDTGDPPTETPGSLTMTLVTDLPKVGGRATGVGVTPGGGVVAIIDGGLYSIAPSGGTPQLINGDPLHTNMAVAPSGEIYALTATEFRTYAPGASTPTIAPIDPAGPLAVNRRVEDSEITFSPSGEPFVTLINNFPNTYTYYSSDKGATWNELTFPNNRVAMLYAGDIAFAPNGDILATDYQGIYRTSDRGTTWTAMPAPRANYGGKLLVAANGDIYHYVPGGGGLLVSRNGGASFTEISPFNNPPYFASIRQGEDGALYALAGRKATSAMLSERPGSLLRSSDGGVTWKHLFYCEAHEFAMRGSTIAIGLSGSLEVAGGVCLSRNYGGTWVSSGLKSVETIHDFGFDRDGKLMILADRELFRQDPSGWQSLGSQQGYFWRFTSTPQGNLLVASPQTFFYSGDNGVTWVEYDVPDYLYGGIGRLEVPALLGKKDGEFLVSVTTYRSDIYPQTHTNGALYRVGTDGKPKRITGADGNFVGMVEDNSGTLYGRTVNFADDLKSTDGGATWRKDEDKIRAIAFNAKNDYLLYGELGSMRAGRLGSTETKEVKLNGFTSQTNYVSSARFDRNGRLYLLTMDKGLFISDSPF